MIRYLVAGAFLPLLAACANFPTMRTSMPPVPAETAPGAAAPAPVPAEAPAPDLSQQVQSLEVRVKQLESQLAQLESRSAIPAPVKARPQPAAAPAGSPKPAPPAAASAASEKHFNDGMRLYRAKKYKEARTELYNYLKSQPKGAKASEARYYLADSFYLEGKYREAGVEFNKLQLQFPKSILLPASLLRQALCYKNQQQMTAYRSTLNKLVKAYPGSPEAKEAKKMLQGSPKEAGR